MSEYLYSVMRLGRQVGPQAGLEFGGPGPKAET